MGVNESSIALGNRKRVRPDEVADEDPSFQVPDVGPGLKKQRLGARLESPIEVDTDDSNAQSSLHSSGSFNPAPSDDRDSRNLLNGLGAAEIKALVDAGDAFVVSAALDVQGSGKRKGKPVKKKTWRQAAFALLAQVAWEGLVGVYVGRRVPMCVRYLLHYEHANLANTARIAIAGKPCTASGVRVLLQTTPLRNEPMRRWGALSLFEKRLLSKEKKSQLKYPAGDPWMRGGKSKKKLHDSQLPGRSSRAAEIQFRRGQDKHHLTTIGADDEEQEEEEEEYEPQPVEASNFMRVCDLQDRERHLHERYWGLHHETDAVRCEICAAKGHLPEACPARRCLHCGQFDRHFSNACPSRRKCERCQELGHTIEQCQSELGKNPTGGVVCDLCKKPNHIVDRCPLLWKTFRPEEILQLKRVNKLLVSCYRCGSDAHWGDDCRIIPKRSKKLQNLVDTFSNSQASQYLLRSTEAEQHNRRFIRSSVNRSAAAVASDEDDSSKFLGRKVETRRKPGSIHIKSPIRERPGRLSSNQFRPQQDRPVRSEGQPPQSPPNKVRWGGKRQDQQVRSSNGYQYDTYSGGQPVSPKQPGGNDSCYHIKGASTAVTRRESDGAIKHPTPLIHTAPAPGIIPNTNGSNGYQYDRYSGWQSPHSG